MLLRSVGRLRRATDLMPDSVEVLMKAGVVWIRDSSVRYEPLTKMIRTPIVAVLPREPIDVFLETSMVSYGGIDPAGE